MKHEKTISLNIWTLSWPICIEVFLQMLVGNIDQIMMSHYSQEAVAAVAHRGYVHGDDNSYCPVPRGEE